LVSPLGAHAVHPGVVNYWVAVPVASPAAADGAVSVLRQRVWYAAQRAGLHLDDVKSGTRRKGVYLAEHIGDITAGLGLDGDAAATILAAARVLPYAAGEVIQSTNSIPQAMGFVTDGVAEMFVIAEDGRRLPIGELGVGEYFGGSSLTRQRTTTGVSALTDMSVVAVSREAMNAIVQKDHRLARQIGDSVDMRRRAAREALAEAARGLV
jgi:hypothetical protein